MKFNKTEPIYIQIAHDILRKIFINELRLGEKLQGVRDLAKEYSTTPKTIQNASNYLEQLNIVTKHQGSKMIITNKEDNIKLAKQIILDKINLEYQNKLKSLGLSNKEDE